MPDNPTQGRPSEEPDPSITAETQCGETPTAHPAEDRVAWYSTQGPTQSPRRPDGGKRRRRRGIMAAVAIAVAILLAGVAVGTRLSTTDVATTSLTQPPSAGATQQAPSWGDGSSSTPSPYGESGDSSSSSTDADVSAIAAKISPAIVNITVSSDYTSSNGAATGIVLTSDGLVLTNNHVIEGSTDISATDVGNGETYSATVVGYDTTHDIALIQLQNASGLETAGIGDSSSLAVGDTVVGVGNAGGDGGEPDAVGGVVVALDQDIVASDQSGSDAEQLTGLIQTDANIQSGDSGGPLVNADGTVIGVMVAASASNGYYGSSSGTEGYAVPIDTAMEIVNQIKSGTESGTVHIGETAFLGVQVVSDASGSSSGYGDPYGYGGSGDPYGYGDSSDSYGYGDGSSGQSGTTSAGATVGGVVSGSPAEDIGLAAGDVITAVDGDTVTSASGLSELIAAHHPGDKVTITWTDSSGSQHSEQVELTNGPAA